MDEEEKQELIRKRKAMKREMFREDLKSLFSFKRTKRRDMRKRYEEAARQGLEKERKKKEKEMEKPVTDPQLRSVAKQVLGYIKQRVNDPSLSNIASIAEKRLQDTIITHKLSEEQLESFSERVINKLRERLEIKPATPKKYNYCMHCRGKINPGDKYCMYCGQPVPK